MSEDILERAKRVEYPDSALRILPELIAEVEANQIMLRQFQVHEDQTHAAMEKIVGNSDNFVELTRQMKAEVERLRSIEAQQLIALESTASIVEHQAARIKELEAYIERLEAAFLEQFAQGIQAPKEKAELMAREALERIKEGQKG